MAHLCKWMGNMLFPVFIFLSWLLAFARISLYVWHALPSSLIVKELPFLQRSGKYLLCPKVFLDFLFLSYSLFLPQLCCTRDLMYVPDFLKSL